MGRIGYYPDTVEDCKTISITNLKNWGYLSRSMKGTLTWSRNGKETGNIGIKTIVQNGIPPLIRLEYVTTWRDGTTTSYNYAIRFVSVSSNLGKGQRYYFLCPHTGKRALKFYKAPGYGKWAHRERFDLCHEKQIQSKSYRFYEVNYGPIFKLEKLHRQFNHPAKWRKTHYRGKPARWYRELAMKIHRLEVRHEQAIRNFGHLRDHF